MFQWLWIQSQTVSFSNVTQFQIKHFQKSLVFFIVLCVNDHILFLNCFFSIDVLLYYLFYWIVANVLCAMWSINTNISLFNHYNLINKSWNYYVLFCWFLSNDHFKNHYFDSKLSMCIKYQIITRLYYTAYHSASSWGTLFRLYSDCIMYCIIRSEVLSLK